MTGITIYNKDEKFRTKIEVFYSEANGLFLITQYNCEDVDEKIEMTFSIDEEDAECLSNYIKRFV